MSSNISSLLHAPQRFVDNIGMYRLVSGALASLVVVSIGAGFLGFLPYSGVDQIVAVLTALIVALVLNVTIGFITKIPVNHESAIITALILFFLVIPGESLAENWPLAAAVGIGILSKFLIAPHKQHMMNPAAVGAVALSLPGFYVFSWWVGNPTLFIFLLIAGTLVTMKVRKWTPVLSFVGVGLLVYLFESWQYGMLNGALQTYFLSWPTLFLAFFMLTEPFTMPPTKKTQAAYGALVGFLSNTTLFAPLFGMTPEFALVIGNLAVGPLRVQQKLFLHLKEKRQIATDTFEFIFLKPKGFSFAAGQYLEWMLPHKGSDDKGIRRYFTIASSPTESEVRVAMKISEKGSTFKKALRLLDLNESVIASQLAGDFTLPKDVSRKLGFIAGGIGITPFRSHIQYMLDSDKAYDSVLYYCNNTVGEIAYSELFKVAEARLPFKVVNVIAKEPVSAPFETGFVTLEMLKRQTPDYLERTWYISGPPPMVAAYTRLLREAGVARRKIVRDFFPGAV